MKTLRSVLTTAVCLILTLLCTFTAFAKTDKYQIKELGMSLEFPESMTVITTETEGASLGDDVYLSATDASGSLSIYVSMIQNEKTQEIYSFANLTSDALEDYENEILQNDEYTNCRKGTYGKVNFLDFSQKYTQGMVDIYGRQSITLINGMSIYITSQSIGDDFTTEELDIIKGVLESIKFKETNDEEPKVNVLAIIIWIVVILILLGGIFLLVSFLLGRQKTIERREKRREKKRQARENYDVLSTDLQEEEKPQGLSGYKSSDDYFENIDSDSSALATRKDSPLTKRPQKASFAETIVPILKTISLGTKTAFTHLGYFCKNLSRMVSKSIKASQKSKKRSKQARRGASKEYDVFRDR